MKLAYKELEQVLRWEGGVANELVVENKKLFFEMVNSLAVQSEGQAGNWVLSQAERPLEFSRFADVTLQFAPFPINRKAC